MAISVYSRTLRKAAELLGGNEKLCRELQVPAEDLGRWLADTAVPPIAVFLRAVDLVLSETAPPGSEPSDPPASRDCSGAEPASHV